MVSPQIIKVTVFYFLFVSVVPATSMAIENNASNKNINYVFKIGVRAVNGIADAKKTWSKTVEALNENIPSYKFKLVPIVDFQDMRAAAKNKKIDFVLTNPLAYIQLNKKSGVTRLLTLNKKQPNGVASTTFASVIFTRSNRDDVNNLDDSQNKSIIAVHEEAFGGWRMALREFINNGIDPHSHSSKVIFTTDNTHQSVIYSVLDGDTDIGVVRTGIIEQLIAEGKIKSGSIKVLNPHKDNLSALHSTQHYPEWPFSVMPHVSSDVSNKVFHTLLSIKSDSPAAIAGKYLNWTAPLDYSEVYNLVEQLTLQHITFTKIWNKHWLTIVLLLVFTTSIIFYTLYLFSINRKLTLSKIELSQHQNHLKEMVNTRTTELTNEKVKAEKENKAKSDFLFNMSHEIRTPLNAILGFSQLIKLQEAENKNISSNVDEIMTAGDFLLSLINEILDLAKIESGDVEFNLEKVSCNDVLRDSLNIVAPLIKKNNITLSITKPDECFVTADYKRLQQTCINLLSNAIKYNKQGGHIDIEIKQNDHQSELRIKDSGIGIKPEFYDQVFKPFARDEGNSGLIEGTGVGLVITKNLIEKMHGKIGFRSEYGKGTEFWVTLPIA